MKKNIEPLSTPYTTFLTRNRTGMLDRIKSTTTKFLIVNPDGGDLFNVTEGMVYLKGIAEDIPVFHHPIALDDDRMLIDVRGMLNRDGGLANRDGVRFLENRARLDQAWNDDWELFSLQSDMVVDTFSNWFANGLSLRLSIDPTLTVKIKVLAAIYYLGRITREEIDMKDRDIEAARIRLLRSIPRITRVPAQTVDNTIMENLEGTIGMFNVIYSGTTDDKLDELAMLVTKVLGGGLNINHQVIYNALASGSFISNNVVENVGVAMQHPPLFYLMVHTSLEKGIFSKTHIGRAVINVSKKHTPRDLSRFVERIIDK